MKDEKIRNYLDCHFNMMYSRINEIKDNIKIINERINEIEDEDIKYAELIDERINEIEDENIKYAELINERMSEIEKDIFEGKVKELEII